jgi:putative heme iron utilization protein
MELFIHKHKSAKHIQDEFHECYPFLKIEFLKTAHENKPKFMNHQYVQDVNELIAALPDGKEIQINIDNNRTLAQVKKDFSDMLGVLTQFFRKSGNVWIETSLTDDWTLERQNKEGELLSSPFHS